MRKIILLVCFGLLLNAPVFCQNIHIGVSSGIAFPTLESAKSQLTGIQKSLPFEAKITDNFPAWIEYKAEFYVDYDNIQFGFYIVKSSTGGRISSKDFSANYSFDEHMSCIAFGPVVKILVIEFNKTRVFLSAGGGPELLNTNILEKIELNANNQTKTYLNVQDKKQGFHGNLGFSADYKFSSWFSASIYLNYYFSSFNVDKTTYNTVYTSINGQGFIINPKWNGPRTGLSVFFTIPKKVD